ncbi:MAG: hypothetical protein PHP08_02470 [Candidatus Dojkabacteria bacterium]|nr:hypothetical protein [Candidatus Dojkabacteria bacterium]
MADQSQQKVNPKIKKDLATLSERAKKSQLKISDLIIPIAVIIVLILLSVLVFIPMINKANEYRSELKEVNQKIETLDSLQTALNEMDSAQLVSDLLVAKQIIPKVLQVSDFVYYIDTLARSKNLTTKEISAGDVSVGGGEQTTVKKSLGVSGPLSYSGSYTSILEFLDEIQAYSPYLVTLKNISMSHGGDDTWSVDFDLTGYYIPETDTDVDLYIPFSKYTQFSDIIDIFSVRVSKLEE